MKRFDFENGYSITCTFKETKNGFAHVCELWDNDYHATGLKHKVNYLNRTWERFEFETCMNELISKAEKEGIKLKEVQS